MVESLYMVGQSAQNPGYNYTISTQCSTSDDDNQITLNVASLEEDQTGTFSGMVECNPSQVEGHATQTSSSTTGSSQDGDGDGDGIPDSSDKYPRNSNPRCYKDS